MHGVFVSSAYLRGRKFEEPWEMLRDACSRRGVELRRMSNSELAVPVGDPDLKRRLDDPDFVLFWDKDTVCAANLEMCGMRVFNPSECIRVCDDKALTHLALARRRIPSIETVVCPMSYGECDDPDFVLSVTKIVEFPMVAKDRFGSFGQQVRMVSDENELMCLISGQYVPRILQPYIDCGGHDVRVEAVGGRPIAAMSRTAPPGDFRSNASIGGTLARHEPDSEESELAIRACEAVGADFAGVDIISTSDGPVVCEVNSNAHIRNLLDCTGINAADAIVDHVISEVRGRGPAGSSTTAGTWLRTRSSPRGWPDTGATSGWTSGPSRRTTCLRGPRTAR